MTRIDYLTLQAELTVDDCREFSVFGALSNDSIEYLLRNGDLLHLESEEKLYELGDKSDCFFIVLSGQLAFHKVHKDHSCLVRNFGPGEELGFVGMISLHPRAGWARMVETGVLLRVSCNLFHDFQQRNANEFTLLLINLVRDKSRELTAANNMVVELSRPE